jgi:hypothetical protein
MTIKEHLCVPLEPDFARNGRAFISEILGRHKANAGFFEPALFRGP